MSDIARHYDASKNPGGEKQPAMFPGVPLRDITLQEWEALPVWLRRSIDASPMYVRAKGSPPPDPEPAPPPPVGATADEPPAAPEEG